MMEGPLRNGPVPVVDSLVAKGCGTELKDPGKVGDKGWNGGSDENPGRAMEFGIGGVDPF